MRQKFSKLWIRSKQPRKQRKYNYNAPLHIRRKFGSSTLDKTLRKKYGIRNIEIRKGDETKVMRGKLKGKQGKVGKVDVKKTRISIEGLQKTKKDGTKVNIWFHPSKVKIISLNLEDKRRLSQPSVKVEEVKTAEVKDKKPKEKTKIKSEKK